MTPKRIAAWVAATTGTVVPPTAVITTEAYRRFVELDEIAEMLETLRNGNSDDIEDHEAERERIDDCFANAETDDEIAMAVVVMAMVDADTAGVLFTIDPAGQGATARIEVLDGLGESLVFGEETPDVHVLDRESRSDADNDLDPTLEELLDCALQLDDHFGGPLDIELAVAQDRLSFLQARPISSSPAIVGEGDDSSFSHEIIYTTAGIGEMLPGYLPPLLWDCNSWAVEEAFRSLFHQLGSDVVELHQPHRLIARFRGRAALNLDAMKASAASISGGSAQELERQYFGSSEADQPCAAGRPPVIIPLAIATGLASFRCRILAWAWPIAVVGGGLLNVVLGWVTHRLRPELGAHAGEFTSFPEGHAVTDRRSVRIAFEVGCGLLWIVVFADTVRSGGHWPSDQLAGLLLVAAAVVAIRSAARNPTTHPECDPCPLVGGP